MTRRTLPKLSVFAIISLISASASAQFTPGLLANDSYWSDGKAEFDIYDGQLMRGGELRYCEVLHILLRQRIDPKALAPVSDAKRSAAINAVSMQQIWSAPLGLFVEQGSLTAMWRLDSIALAQLNFIRTGSFGNVIKRMKPNSELPTWNLISDTDRGGEATTSFSAPSNFCFADELPLRVRTIDFTKPPIEFEISLAPSITEKDEALTFTPAKVSWKPAGKSVEVVVLQGSKLHHFVLDRDFPFLLREWTMPDGSKLKMKRGLKADYWNYGRNGDRERALKNPTLQHPD